MVTGTAPGLVGKPCDLGNVSRRRGGGSGREGEKWASPKQEPEGSMNISNPALFLRRGH